MKYSWGLLMLGLACWCSLVQAQQPLAPPQQPTEAQLELRLSDEAFQHQRSLCAYLWSQGNTVEAKLTQAQDELTKEKAAHAKTKEELAMAQKLGDGAKATSEP